MKLRIFDTKEQAAVCAADTVEGILNKKPDAVLCLAAGHTSIPIFDELAGRRTDFSRARFIGLDEWAGVPAGQEGSCAWFLEKNFFSRVNAKRENISLFDGMARDLEAACQDMEERLSLWGGIDYLLLGMGMNGHLALNEPGDGFVRKAHPVTLSQTTIHVAPKYFPGGMPPITEGVTLGIGTLLGAGKIQLAVFGAHKKEGVKRLLELSQKPDTRFPASALYLADAAELLLDGEAADQSVCREKSVNLHKNN